jgi:hypothetical protein
LKTLTKYFLQIRGSMPVGNIRCVGVLEAGGWLLLVVQKLAAPRPKYEVDRGLVVRAIVPISTLNRPAGPVALATKVGLFKAQPAIIRRRWVCLAILNRRGVSSATHEDCDMSLSLLDMIDMFDAASVLGSAIRRVIEN